MKYKILLLSIALFFTTFINAQTKTSVIQTSAECGSCKIRIEDKLNYTKGIKFSELNLKDKKVTVKYSTKKISLDQIKKVISETGYDADNVKAISSSVDKLPVCCKPGGMK
jgi:copper chaperone CopZ